MIINAVYSVIGYIYNVILQNCKMIYNYSIYVNQIHIEKKIAIREKNEEKSQDRP